MFSLSSKDNTTTGSDDTSFTFEVDKVPPKQSKPYLIDFNQAFSGIIGRSLDLVASSHDNDNEKKFVHVGYRMTGAVKAIHEAYMNHYNLKLSVSDFILMIGHGLASHMEKHAEELRRHFVDFEGKEKITVESLTVDWPNIIEQFSLEVRKRVKTDLYDVIIDDTSVATKLSKMASEIAIMDAFKYYFKYIAMCACGIPKITLVGSKDDWERLRNKVRKLQELNRGDILKLNWWLEHLIPLVEKIVDQAISRKIDVKFWQAIYKFQEGQIYRSAPKLDGWITKFIPYLTGGRNTFDKEVHPNSIPTGVSKVPFTLTIVGQSSKEMFLYGGFIGAQLIGKDTVEPAYFYAVGPESSHATDSLFM